jgi:hypothetical protein
VEDDIKLLSRGLRELVWAYQDLDEPAMAREAVDRILGEIKQAGLPDAIRKARLLPLSAGIPAPEFYLSSFIDAVNTMETALLPFDHRPLIAMDIKPEELLIEHHHPLRMRQALASGGDPLPQLPAR